LLERHGPQTVDVRALGDGARREGRGAAGALDGDLGHARRPAGEPSHGSREKSDAGDDGTPQPTAASTAGQT
jgi:hypothetical protein